MNRRDFLRTSVSFALACSASSCRQTPTNTDALAPAAPASIRVTGSLSALVVSWQAVASNSDGTMLTDLGGYNIYRSLIPARGFESAGSVGAAQTEWRDVNVRAGEIWYYKVKAVDKNGNESAFSPESPPSLLSIRVSNALLPQAGAALYLNYNGQTAPPSDSRSDLTITRFGETFVVLSRFCTHAGCSNMVFENALWTCRCHGSQFTQQGRVVAPPAQSDLTVFNFTRESNGDLVVSFS